MEIASQKYRTAVALVTGKRFVSVSEAPPSPILFPEAVNLEIALRGPAWQQIEELNMNAIPKGICQELLQLSYENGFGRNSGIMWEFGSFGNGMIRFSNRGGALVAAVAVETRDLLATWCDFRL